MKVIKSRFFCWFIFCLAVAVSRELKADVTSYSIFKVASYRQLDSGQPLDVDAPNAFYFGAQLFGDTNINEVISDASVTAPDSTFYPMSEKDPGIYYTYNSPYFESQADMDAAYPGGAYQFEVNDGADFGNLNEPTNAFYSDSIPYFTGGTWTNLQSLDPTQPFTITWNSFNVRPSANAAYIFIRILDTLNFSYAFTQDFLPSSSTNFTLPAYTLGSGKSYQIQLLFSDRQNSVGSGFLGNVSATAGFDNLTFTSLLTLPPALSISLAGTNVVLSWPSTAGNYNLEQAAQVPGGHWSIVPFPPAVVGNQLVVTNAVSSTAQFFRLHIPQLETSIRSK